MKPGFSQRGYFGRRKLGVFGAREKPLQSFECASAEEGPHANCSIGSTPGSAERTLGISAPCSRRQLPSAWRGWASPELVATKNATKTFEGWPPALSRLAPRNPAPAAGKLHLGRSLWARHQVSKS